MSQPKKNKRALWQPPWGFAESLVVVCGMLVTGFALQFAVGSFNFYLLASPVNYITGGIILLVCVLLSFRKNSRFLKWFSGIYMAVSLILALLILCIIMGLTPQATGVDKFTNGTVFMKVGFTQMTRSWPFVLIYLMLLISLGCLIIRRFRSFRWQDYGFYLNHAGLWLVLFAAGLGHADIERYIMHVREGETEWRVFDESGKVKELPVAIQLNDFDMEEYPPKLTIIDRNTGIAQPESNPDYYQIDAEEPQGKLNGWNIEVEEYIHQAVRNSDSTYYEVPMAGATPAAFVKANNPTTGETYKGWVCGGNQAQLYMTLPLSEQYCMVMTRTEPKRFVSDIDVYAANGEKKKALLEVNKPVQIGNWAIYQYGYDNQAGRLSSYSSMELVYDPWKIPVFIGFILIASGAIAMIWNGRS